MRLLRNRAVGHRTRLKALHDLIHALHLFNGHALLRVIKIHQTAQIAGFLAVHARRVFLEHLVIALFRRLLQQMDRQRIVAVLLALAPRFVASDAV